MIRLSQTLASFVAERRWLDETRARRISREACEKATVTLAAASPARELGPLVRHLRETGQLNAGLMLRTLLCGNLPLFEQALAELSGLPPARVTALVNDRRGAGARALCERAGLPESTEETMSAPGGFLTRSSDMTKYCTSAVLRLTYHIDTRGILPSFE